MYYLKLTSSYNAISLPTKHQNIKKLKITSMQYMTVTANQRNIDINIIGWNDKFYYNGTQVLNYTRIMPLSPVINSVSMYENNDLNYWDVIKTSGSMVGNLLIELKIDGVFDDDIDVSNPFFIEIAFE